MERNENGYPIREDGCQSNDDASLGGKPLAYAYVPIQSWRMLYSPEKALMRATLFEELDMPKEVYGNE